MIAAERGRFVTGLVIGLLAGLAVALAVALYITKAPVPFVNKVPQRPADQDAVEAERNKHWDPNAPLAGKNPVRPQAVAVPTPPAQQPGNAGDAAAPPAPPTTPTATTAPTAVAQRPAAVPAAGAAAVPPEPGSSASAPARAPRDPASILAGQNAPPAKPAAPPAPSPTAVPAPTPSFFVQAGAYSRTEDAEQQRARLALMGLAARITEREQSGRTVYRVRLGPFDGREEAEDAQGKLSAAGVDANLVRVER